MATYLITQATGQQSRRVISHLLAAGVKIHADVRDLQKVPPILLEPNAKTDVEACQEAGVENIVVATTHGTLNKAMWDDDATKGIQLHRYFSSKSAVEEIVRAGKFQAYTMLRPAVIHHEFFLPGALGNFRRLPTHGELDHLLREGARVPYTDANDMGKYATAALLNPAKFGSQEIDLGNELLTIREVRDILIKVSGREVRAIRRTPEEVEKMGFSVFGQRFHLMADIKDLSWTTAVAEEIQANLG